MRYALEKGFTLIELILAIALTIVLAAGVIAAINPVKRLAESRNSQRWAGVTSILNAVHQYAADHSAAFPAAIPESTTCASSANEICKEGASCAGLVNLSVLTEVYLIDIPADPIGASANGTGYYIAKSVGGTITVCAPSAELSEEISVTR